MSPTPTHVYCEECCGVERVEIEDCVHEHNEHYLSGDIICGRCRHVIATLYVVNERVMHGSVEGR